MTDNSDTTPMAEDDGVTQQQGGQTQPSGDTLGGQPSGDTLGGDTLGGQPSGDTLGGDTLGGQPSGDTLGGQPSGDTLGGDRPDPSTSASKDPEQWVTGAEPMTGPQRSYLDTLAHEAGEELSADLTKAEASEQIDRLQSKTGRGQG
jgi:hypothetical protein